MRMNLEKYANEQLANSSSSFATTETDYMTLKRNSDTMVDRYGIAEEFRHAMHTILDYGGICAAHDR